jgi:hypothetical protein
MFFLRLGDFFEGNHHIDLQLQSFKLTSSLSGSDRLLLSRQCRINFQIKFRCRHVNAPNGSDSLYFNGWTKCFLTAFINRWFMSLHAVHDLGLGVSNFRQSKFLLNRLIDHTTQHAMFTRELTTPALTLEQTYGRIPLRVVINRDGKPRNSDIDRFGFYNPQPYIYESLLDYWRDRMNGMDDYRLSTASPSHPWSASRVYLEWTLRTLESRDQALGHDAPELSQTELRL